MGVIDFAISSDPFRLDTDEMACSCVESAAHLTRSYAAFAKLALQVTTAKPQSVQFWESLTKSLQNLTDQLSCGSCGNFAALSPHPDPHATSLSPGILCSGCASRKATVSSGNANNSGPSADGSDEKTALSLFKSTVTNLTLLCSILWQDISALTGGTGENGHSSESDDDDEVTFSPTAVASIPPSLLTLRHSVGNDQVVTVTQPALTAKVQSAAAAVTKANRTTARLVSKFRQRLRAVCTLLKVSLPPSPPPSLPNSPVPAHPLPTNLVVPSLTGSKPTTHVIITNNPAKGSGQTGNGTDRKGAGSLGSPASVKGCRCGAATSMPGKLTCCGQRCPCYVKSASCSDCKCRGCRNPHRPNGEKRPYPFTTSSNGNGNEPAVISSSIPIHHNHPKVVIQTTSIVTGSVHKITYTKFPR